MIVANFDRIGRWRELLIISTNVWGYVLASNILCSYERDILFLHVADIV